MEPPPPTSPPPPPDPSAKLRLMVSYGGHIVPRPHDKSLCYIGGDTRIVVVPRHHLLTLSDLVSRLSNNITSPFPFVVKYQLPNEDLDSLISVSTDEDLENLLDEYDRLAAAPKPGRLRLFLFAKGKGVLDGNAVRSAEWFLGELNGGREGKEMEGLRRGFSDPNSVNCLLGLEESGGSGTELSKGDEGEAKRGTGEGKLTANSVPGSPIVETATSSSFGSSSSSPSLVNLAPIKTHVEGGGVRVFDQRMGEIEEQLSQLGVNHNKHDEDLVVMPSTVVTSVAATGDVAAVMVAAATSGTGGGGNVNRAVSDDERSDQDVTVGYRKTSGTEDQPVMVSSQSQQKLNCYSDLPSPDSVSSDGSHSSALSRQKQMIYQEPSGQVPSSGSRVTANFNESKVGNVSDVNIHAQMQQNSDSGYTTSSQYDLRHQLLQQQQQQQFVNAATHYGHHPPGAVPISAYYPFYASQHPQLSHHPGQYPLYYIPAGPAQTYGLPVQQPNFADSTNTQTPSMISTSAMYSTSRNLPTQKPEMAAGIYRTAAGAAAPPLVQVGTGQNHLPQQQQQFVGYAQMHHPSQSITPTAPFEYADPAHTQLFFSQPLQPPLAAEYQTLTADSALLSADVSAQIPADNVKQQPV